MVVELSRILRFCGLGSHLLRGGTMHVMARKPLCSGLY